MLSWVEIEKNADDKGFIPSDVYNEHKKIYQVCPPQESNVAEKEAEIWRTYLSATGKKNNGRNLYSEMYRYEWYEGRKRNGFWGNIEDAVKKIRHYDNPRITVFSAGSGRDLLKVGLAAGVWESMAPSRIKGTYKEIDLNYFRLAKPGARIIATEFDDGNYSELKKTIRRLKEKNLLTKSMISLSKWNFREKTPVSTESQDLVVFSLTGNYATKEEQPLILREIVRCVKKHGYFVGSTLSSRFDFNKAANIINRLKLIVTTPLGWPIATDFLMWQLHWGRMAGQMNRHGYWANISANSWADFLKPAGMKTIKVYEGPSNIVPVEVLVMEKE